MCCAVAIIPLPEEIRPDTPLRLGTAAAPIGDDDLTNLWAKRGTNWRNDPVS
jgi:hypothetical protein